MFEIGSSLREARQRQGLELDDVVAATLIRGRYLEALEEERFELLPEGFYRRSFLRRYAQFLGLNGDTFVEEYEVRFATSRPEPERERHRRRIGTSGFPPSARLLGFVASLVLVAVGGLAVWQLAGSGGKSPAKTNSAPFRPHVVRPRPRPRPLIVSRRPVVPTPPVRHSRPVLTLTAARGSCWLEVRIGSASGRVVVVRTLEPGQSLRFGLRRALWIRFGVPSNLDATIGERTVSALLPRSAGNIRVAANGLEAAG